MLISRLQCLLAHVRTTEVIFNLELVVIQEKKRDEILIEPGAEFCILIGYLKRLYSKQQYNVRAYLFTLFAGKYREVFFAVTSTICFGSTICKALA